MSRDGAPDAPTPPPDAPTPPPDPRDIDDPARLAEEVRDQREKMAAELRAASLRTPVEPATTYRP